MDFKAIAALLREMPASQLRLSENEPMRRHTTFRIGGKTRLYLQVQSFEALSQTLRILKKEAVPFLVLGLGSNVLFSDDGFEGAVIRLSGEFKEIRREGDCLIAGAGASLRSLCETARDEGLSGLEFAFGIPGSVGGAVYMNAGAYGGEIRDAAVCAFHTDYDGNIGVYTGEELAFGYRISVYSGKKLIITGAKFALIPGDRDEIARRMEEILERRRSKQPLEFPSAGSVFKRPEGYYAGALIEGAGLKGAAVGAAQVSEKHAGFIINRGGATCADVFALIGKIQKTVLEKDGVLLEPEIRRMP